ncbi:MAG TPA: 16S rRNA (uracil(1498)-N(3))-methyltransferase [Anaeromyxobacteraceae bacterium]|nr:16S rRNA (uracil(1498)-N(3))-methyltransferase [Anaeromyxobacteraceae bacterium]
MNLVLLEPSELAADGTARLGGRRAQHITTVLRAGAGDRILVGCVGGLMGEAEVHAAGDDEVVLSPVLDRRPPTPSPVSLLVAVPRPKSLRKVLQCAAAMGVKRIALVGSYRVEKSYFGSPLLAPGAIREQLLLGLEQGRDTTLPTVTIDRFFKPFVEDRLDAAFPSALRLLAHPVDAPPIEALAAQRAPGAAQAVVAIGPEGGWTGYEVEALRQRGFLPFSMGPRALRVDQAVPFAVGQVELALRTFSRTPE